MSLFQSSFWHQEVTLNSNIIIRISLVSFWVSRIIWIASGYQKVITYKTQVSYGSPRKDFFRHAAVNAALAITTKNHWIFTQGMDILLDIMNCLFNMQRRLRLWIFSKQNQNHDYGFYINQRKKLSIGFTLDIKIGYSNVRMSINNHQYQSLSNHLFWNGTHTDHYGYQFTIHISIFGYLDIVWIFSQ